MLKFAEIINEITKECRVGLGTNDAFYQSIGMSKMDIELAYDGLWYLAGYAPEKPTPTQVEQETARAAAYQQEVDPITCHIVRLQATEPVDAEKIAVLEAERTAKVAEIKARYPYPEEVNNE